MSEVMRERAIELEDECYELRRQNERLRAEVKELREDRARLWSLLETFVSHQTALELMAKR
jgi:hypothetical protein